jgi:hypothetical protein
LQGLSHGNFVYQTKNNIAMKNLFNLKQIAAILLLFVSLISCKDDKDAPEPAADLATSVSGRYVFSELSFNGRTIPAIESDLEGDITIKKTTEKTIHVSLDIRSKSSGADFMVYDVDGIDISEASGTIDLVYEDERVAQIKGKKLIINGTDDAGVDFKLTATR